MLFKISIADPENSNLPAKITFDLILILYTFIIIVLHPKNLIKI
jgi:hypothetical protein